MTKNISKENKETQIRGFERLRLLVGGAKRAALFCHIRPDTDTLGAALALALALKSDGIDAGVYCDSEINDYYSLMPGVETVSADYEGGADLLIALDCGDSKRLGKFEDGFLKHKNTVNIDHHQGNTKFAALNILAHDVSSTCEIIYGLITDILKIKPDAAIAANLYMGIAGDTGNFMHSNTTSGAHTAAAALIKYNFDFSAAGYRLFKETSLRRTKLLARALNSLAMYADNRIAVITITAESLKEAGCGQGDSEGIIDYAINIGGVNIGVCITEAGQNTYKVSLRSRGGPDISRVAEAYGGGGHKQASGCIIQGKIQNIVDDLVRLCEAQL